MTFENPQLNILDLPQYQSSAYVGLEKAYLKVMRISAFMFTLFVLGAIIFAIFVFDVNDQLNYWILGIIIWMVLVAFIYLLTLPSFRQKGYAIRDRDLSYKTGLLNRRTTTIPFNRVQHCDIKQGVISRYFGLSKLNVYTAGGAKSDLSIPGLGPTTASKIMDFVLQKTLAYDEEE